MSSTIHPTDNSGPYLDYSKRVDELEEEQRKEAKRRDEDNASNLDTVRSKQNAALAKIEQKWKETAENIRDEADFTLGRERATSRLQEKELQRQLYDRYGRNRSAELTNQQAELARAHEAIQAEREASRSRNAETEAAYSKRLSELETEHVRELEEAITSSKSTGEDSEVAHKNRMALERAREAEFAKKMALERESMMKDVIGQQKQSRLAAESVERSAQNRMRGTEKLEAERRAELQAHYADEATRATELQRDAHLQESASYRAQLRRLNDHQRNYLSDKANGRADAIKEFHQDVKREQKTMADVYARDLENYRRSMKEQDRYLNEVNNENLRQKDIYWSGRMAEENQSRANDRKDLEAVFERNQAQLIEQGRRDRLNGENSRAKLSERMNEQATHSLQRQAETFRGTLERQNREKNAEISRLSQEVVTRSNSDDIALIPTAAEAKMRNMIDKQFRDRAEAHESRDNHARASMQDNFTANLQSTLAEQRALRANAERSNSLERQYERKELMGTIADTEHQRQTSQRDQEMLHQRHVEHLEKGFMSAMDKQRRDYEELLAATRYDAQLSRQNMKQELEFAARMNQRAFTQKQNELIRDYEKRLADQKADYDALLQAAREDGDRRVREAETRTKHEFEAQNRAQEQRIAQIEMRSAEREKTVARNYEDEIDKLKRSYALRPKG